MLYLEILIKNFKAMQLTIIKPLAFLAKIILLNLSIIHKGTIIAKIKSSVFMGVILTPFASIFPSLQLWLTINAIYLQLVTLALILDLIIGIYVHALKFKDFSLKKMVTGFLSKAFLTVAGLVLFEIFKALFKENNVEIGDYVKLTIALVVVSYPLFSAFGNLSEATNGKFPPVGWMNRIRKFQENLNINDLTNKDK